MSTLESLLEQIKIWIESSKHNLWVAEYNLKVAREKDASFDIIECEARIEGIKDLLAKCEAMVSFIERNMEGEKA